MFVTGHTHAAYNCVIDGRPRDQRELVRAARDRHRADDRRGAAASRPSARDNCRSSTQDVRRRPGRAGARRPVHEAVGAAARTSRSARSRRDIAARPATPNAVGREADGRPDRRRAARRHRRRRPRRRGGRVHEPRRRPRRLRASPRAARRATGSSPTGRRSRSSRSATSSSPRRSRGRRSTTCSRPVVRDEHVADRAAAVELDPLLVLEVGGREHLGKPCAGAANPVSGVTIGGAPLNHGRDLPRSPRTTSSPTAATTSVAEGGDQPHDAAGLRHRRAGPLHQAVAHRRGRGAAGAGPHHHDPLGSIRIVRRRPLRRRRPVRDNRGA